MGVLVNEKFLRLRLRKPLLVIGFRVYIQKRYKLSKRYRKLLQAGLNDIKTPTYSLQEDIAQAKVKTFSKGGHGHLFPG